MSEPTPNYKAMRKNYLVNKRMQLKYAFMIGGALAVCLLLMLAHIWLIIESKESELANPILIETMKELRMWMMLSGLIYMFVIPILSIFISHKIAGPVYRLERSVAEVLESSGPIRKITLRDGDELHTLAGLINQLFDRLPGRK